MFPNGKSFIRGWITDFLEGPPYVRRDLWGPGDFTSGLVAVPFTIKDPCGVQDTAALVAGMLGFTFTGYPTLMRCLYNHSKDGLLFCLTTRLFANSEQTVGIGFIN